MKLWWKQVLENRARNWLFLTESSDPAACHHTHPACLRCLAESGWRLHTSLQHLFQSSCVSLRSSYLQRMGLGRRAKNSTRERPEQQPGSGQKTPEGREVPGAGEQTPHFSMNAGSASEDSQRWSQPPGDSVLLHVLAWHNAGFFSTLKNCCGLNTTSGR